MIQSRPQNPRNVPVNASIVLKDKFKQPSMHSKDNKASPSFIAKTIILGHDRIECSPSVKIHVTGLDGIPMERRRKVIEETNRANLHRPPVDLLTQLLNKSVPIIRRLRLRLGNQRLRLRQASDAVAE